MKWQASAQHRGFADTQPARSSVRFTWALERDLSADVSTGMAANGFNGDAFERNLRSNEEWQVFDATAWDARWWLTLNNGLRYGRIFVQKEDRTYRSLGGLDRRGFVFGSELSYPILTRVRGKRALQKVNQQRTHHLANLVVDVRHTETQFDHWALREGPVTVNPFLRSDAVSTAQTGLEGTRLWAETKGEVRLEFEEIQGVSVGVSGGYMHRTDAVRHAYDANVWRASGWLTGASAQWAGRFVWLRDAAINPGLPVVSETGWEAYRYVHTVVNFRVERGMKKGWGVFADGSGQFWRSNAQQVGWYQRGQWNAGSLRIGLVWKRSNQAPWVQDHAPTRQLAPR